MNYHSLELRPNEPVDEMTMCQVPDIKMMIIFLSMATGLMRWMMNRMTINYTCLSYCCYCLLLILINLEERLGKQ